MNYKKYLRQFGLGLGIGAIAILTSTLTKAICDTPLGYAPPSVKNTLKICFATGVGTVVMLFSLEQGEVNVDGIFPK